MFSERLERLIQAALQDGMLTDQEKAAIIKRAQAEGEDIDEVDIYIQSLQQKRQQELKEQAQKAETEEMVAQKKAREAASKARQEEEKKHAKLIRKCPTCGEPIPFGTITCPKCGHVIELDDKNEEIIQLIKDIERCKPTDCYSGGNFKMTEYFPISEYDKNADLKRSYTVKGKNHDGKKYECESKYFELLSEAEWKYRGHAQIESFLLSEKKRIMKVYMDQVVKFMNMGWLDDVELFLSKLEIDYAGEVPESFITAKRKELLSAIEISTTKASIKKTKKLIRRSIMLGLIVAGISLFFFGWKYGILGLFLIAIGAVALLIG